MGKESEPFYGGEGPDGSSAKDEEGAVDIHAKAKVQDVERRRAMLDDKKELAKHEPVPSLYHNWKHPLAVGVGASLREGRI
jgi:hypothetical protein